jgi:hypothetical protein
VRCFRVGFGEYNAQARQPHHADVRLGFGYHTSSRTFSRGNPFPNLHFSSRGNQFREFKTPSRTDRVRQQAEHLEDVIILALRGRSNGGKCHDGVQGTRTSDHVTMGLRESKMRLPFGDPEVHFPGPHKTRAKLARPDGCR